MPRFRVRSFQGRILLAILAVVLVPGAITAVGGTLTMQALRTRAGTLGAWESVAESGRELIASLDSAGVEDPVVREAAVQHREVLSESVRQSRLFAFVADRFVQLLPLGAVLASLLVAGLAYVIARGLARGFSRPITELVGWTERIGRQEALPPARAAGEQGLGEFRVLRTSLRNMADELAQGRAQAIEAARMRSWSDLARRVAHEIKNPLTSMRIAATTLSKETVEPQTDAARVLLEEIERLDHIARTFSQYGKMPEGPRSDVDLLELMTSLVEREAAAGGAVSVEGQKGVIVNAHYDALQRSFRNLLLNAVEAQNRVSEAEVRITVKTSGDEALVELADRGPGIPEELLDDIWNPDVTTKRSGTGLGLAIVRKTVELHGGSVEVMNREGGGALFRIRLPASEEARS